MRGMSAILVWARDAGFGVVGLSRSLQPVKAGDWPRVSSWLLHGEQCSTSRPAAALLEVQTAVQVLGHSGGVLVLALGRALSAYQPANQHDRRLDKDRVHQKWEVGSCFEEDGGECLFVLRQVARRFLEVRSDRIVWHAWRKGDLIEWGWCSFLADWEKRQWSATAKDAASARQAPCVGGHADIPLLCIQHRKFGISSHCTARPGGRMRRAQSCLAVHTSQLTRPKNGMRVRTRPAPCCSLL